MFKTLKNTKGETLLETVIAFIILAMGITFSGMIIGASLRNMDNSKNRIIAVNAAREGIEAMRNIRDTNWLKFNSKRRDCWNHMPPNDPTAGCSVPSPIPPGEYIIYKQGVSPASPDPTQRWRLQKMRDNGATITESPPIPLCANNGDYYYNTSDELTYRCNGNTNIWENIALLYLVDIDPLVDTDLDHDYTNDQDIYNHIYSKDDDVFGEIVKKSILSRKLTIEYLANDGSVLQYPAAVTADYNRMRVTSTVSWRKGAHVFKVSLTTHLTDYLGREQLSG